jgi:hypothetical protein
MQTVAFYSAGIKIDEVCFSAPSDVVARLQLLGPEPALDKISLPSSYTGQTSQRTRAAVLAVHRASFLTRHLQMGSTSTLSKNDSSPVTVADFSAQALILDTLHKLFPEDLFVAEEDSQASARVRACNFLTAFQTRMQM